MSNEEQKLAIDISAPDARFRDFINQEGNKWILFLLFAVMVIQGKAQETPQSVQFIFHPTDSWLFVEQSDAFSYTIKFDCDTMFKIQENMYFCMNRPLQITTAQFDNGEPLGVKGSIKKEKNALLHHKDSEIEYHEQQFNTRLKRGHKMLYNALGKPFLFWWYENPTTIVDEKAMEFDAGRRSISDTLLEIGKDLIVSHMLTMTLVIRGNVTVSLTMPVLDNETLENELEDLSKLMNRVTVYGGLIDVDLLLDRMDVKEYTFRDSLGLVEIDMPDWFHANYTGSSELLAGSLPEITNIYNAVAIYFVPKSEFSDFKHFVETGIANKRDNRSVKRVEEKKGMLRFFYKKSGSYFYCQEVFLEGENAFAVLNFTATASTYKPNLHYFEEFLQGVKVH